MHVNRILAADWSAVHPGPPADAVIINITALDRATPLNVPSVPVEASTQYDVYCWAQAGAITQFYNYSCLMSHMQRHGSVSCSCALVLLLKI